MKRAAGTFFVVLRAVLTMGLSTGALVTFVALCAHADEAGECFPSRRVLARIAHVHRSTITVFVQELEDRGVVQVDRRRARRSKYKIAKWLWEGGERSAEAGVRMKRAAGTFFVVPSAVLTLGLSTGALATFVALCAHADEAGECFPSRRVLARIAHVHRSTITVLVQELEDRGVVQVDRRRARRATSKYKIAKRLWEGGERPRWSSRTTTETEADPPRVVAGDDGVVVQDEGVVVQGDMELDPRSRSTEQDGKAGGPGGSENAPPGPPPIEFEYEFINIEHYVDAWRAAYPGVDLYGEIAAATEYWTRRDVAGTRELRWPQQYLERRFANRLAEARAARDLDDALYADADEEAGADEEPPEAPW